MLRLATLQAHLYADPLDQVRRQGYALMPSAHLLQGVSVLESKAMMIRPIAGSVPAALHTFAPRPFPLELTVLAVTAHSDFLFHVVPGSHRYRLQSRVYTHNEVASIPVPQGFTVLFSPYLAHCLTAATAVTGILSQLQAFAQQGMYQPPYSRASVPAPPQQPAAPPSVDIERLKAGFRKWSQGSDLTRTKFNDALGMLEQFGYRNLRDTPLGNRLFDIFDTDKGGLVSEEEFIKGMSAILREDGMNKRLEYTFRAYDETGLNYITRDALWYIMENSWNAAFRLLAVKTKDMKYLTALQIETWSQTQVSKLKNMIYEEFQRLDNEGIGMLDKPKFYQWASIDHTIVAEMESVRIEVPVSLMHVSLKKVEYPNLTF